MGRGGNIDCKRSFKERVRSKDRGSDDSDEDYVVENEENVSDDDSVDLEMSLDGYASEESFGGFDEEEEEEEERKVRKVGKPKKNKYSSENGKTTAKISLKRKRVSCEEEYDDNGDDEDYVNDDNEDDDGDDDQDEEFAPDEDDCLDEDEDVTMRKKSNKVKQMKNSRQERGSGSGQKRGRKSRVPKKTLAKKGRTNHRLRKKERLKDDEDDGDFVDSSPVVKRKSKKNTVVRRRKSAVYSDSDFMSSASSDYDYTISEEEREQVREASELYGGLKTNLRSSSSARKIQESGDFVLQRKPLGRKGKEKVKEINCEVGKQVCGICLSEEDKRRLRGALDCCSHYFCFTCIMEWSKVESRCPLCKQRFGTITKNGRLSVGLDQRNMVIQVPKRDQVYQMSEEEIRSFIDPYENVICTECHEGGDDGLMLLCDLCDSPAHTYCVGLGRQVPDGNWYCNDCRHVALGSSSARDHDASPDQRTTTNIFIRPPPVGNLEGLDPTLESSPRLAFAQGFGNLSSPRFPTGDGQVASPVSGAGAPTLSMRRQLHRHIQNMLSSNRMHLMSGRADGFSTADMRNDVSNSQIATDRETAISNSRTQEMGTSQPTFIDERVQASNYPSSSLQNIDSFPLRPSQLSRQLVQDSTITPADRSVNLTLWPEFMGISSLPGYRQFHQQNSRLNIGSNVNLSPYRVREDSQFYAVKEQLRSMVRHHLESLSHDHELGSDTFKDIVRSSTHTILAACGFEHRRSEVHTVHPPSICPHVDGMPSGQTSLMKGLCPSCFDSYVRDVVKRIKDTRMPQWLSLGL